MTTPKRPTDQTTMRSPSERAPTADQASLVVFTPAGSEAYPVPRRGLLVIGRGEDCDLQISHPSISRRHFRLHLGNRAAVEDLESSNGTFLREKRLDKGQKLPVHYGETIRAGDITFVLQRDHVPSPTDRILPYAHFETKLAEQCELARSEGTTMALLHVIADADADSFARVLGPHLRPEDLVGEFAPDEYQILLSGVSAIEAREFVKRFKEVLTTLDPEATVAQSFFPSDGTSSNELSHSARHRAHGTRPSTDEPIILDAAMIALYESVDRAAVSPLSVLLLGESGVGKEVVANAVHRRSDRRDKPFISINCAALPAELIEGELFGHRKGAFTGAEVDKKGLIASADGGTLFLDEIGEMPLELQSKLLRVLEERTVRPVGSSETTVVDVRFVAATNADLEKRIEAGHFRTDLYYRLAGVTLLIPPLRDRPGEIEALAELFTLRQAEVLGWTSAPSIDPEVMGALRRHNWPGNIRELRNVIERAVILCDGAQVTLAELPLERMTGTSPSAAAAKPAVANVVTGSSEEERIRAALRECGGNQSEAAKLLGMPRRTLVRRLDKYGIARPRKKSD